MWSFIIGFFVGGIIAMFAIALCQANKLNG